ncbi:MAG: nitroreductase [Saprospiraceae bacterium]
MSKILPEQVNELIKKRRSIFPKSYIQKPIPKEIIEQILENANWAPTHKLTEPWRFKIFRNDALEQLGIKLSEVYKANTSAEKFSEMKFKKTQKKALQSDTMIAICMQRDPKESIPEWEEIASVGAAVQNMYLTCAAYNIGCYWSSPGTIKYLNEYLGLKDGERCLGFLYMGYHEMPEIKGMRRSIAEKIEWK